MRDIAALLRFLVARPLPVPAEGPDGDPLGLPSFRPLSFLSNLAERVLPPDPDEAAAAPNGHRPGGETQAPVATGRSMALAPGPEAAPPPADPARDDQPRPDQPTAELAPADQPIATDGSTGEPLEPAHATEEAGRG